MLSYVRSSLVGWLPKMVRAKCGPSHPVSLLEEAHSMSMHLGPRIERLFC